MNYYDVVFKSNTPGLTSKTCYENTKSTLEI
jgi:hypothetical protein